MSSSRRYFVDVGKIKKALEWLKRNNHLYANVQFNFELTSDDINESILQSVTTQQHECVEQSEQCHFKHIGDDKFILRGHFNQGNDRFGVESRGRQCMANSAMLLHIQC